MSYNTLHYRSNPYDGNRSPGNYYGINNGRPEYAPMDWDAISHLEDATFPHGNKRKRTEKPSIFKRFLRAVLGINLLFGTHSDDFEEPARKKRKLNRGKGIMRFPWKGLFDSQESVAGELALPPPPPPRPSSTITLYWPTNSPLFERDPITNEPIPPMDHIINVTRAASPAAKKRNNNYRYGIKLDPPVFNFPEVVATTTVDDLLSLSPVPDMFSAYAPPPPPPVQMPSVTHRGNQTPFYSFNETITTVTVPEFPIPSTPVVWDTQSILSDAEGPVKFSPPTPIPSDPRNKTTNREELVRFAAPTPRPVPQRMDEVYKEECFKITIFDPEPEDRNDDAYNSDPPPKRSIFTSRVRFPLSLGVGHVTYKLREKPEPKRLRRPSWASLTSHHSEKDVEESIRPTSPLSSPGFRFSPKKLFNAPSLFSGAASLFSGPALQFPTLSFGASKYRPGLNEDEEEEEKEEEKEERPVYDIMFFDRPGPGAIMLALAEFVVPEGYDPEYASVHVNYGEDIDADVPPMAAYRDKAGEAEKMKDSGVVVFMFMPEE
ncbi:hypothetical protein BJ508DRAFT_376090 [Ascobolus immersus RN42]|uniref:Uncharacterized protein n=1 Tax=Ascobolus immersus RN42 TaxID=1160509 RepID=A0A3N4I922_ASCIM|nr:hypothetical protein BJ508DRAFT_376090 [Ascobolus immersus RN42]